MQYNGIMSTDIIRAGAKRSAHQSPTAHAMCEERAYGIVCP